MDLTSRQSQPKDPVRDHAHRQLQTFLDELKNGTKNHATVASLSDQVAQEYRGRCVLELLQNAHDALANGLPGSERKVTFLLRSDPDPVLLVANDGHPFTGRDFESICNLGQSSKDPNESVGNKGLGFRSVLEVSTRPEVWSVPLESNGHGFQFRFDPSVLDDVVSALEHLRVRGLGARSPFDPGSHLVDWSEDQLEQFFRRISGSEQDVAEKARTSLSPYSFPLSTGPPPQEVRDLWDIGHVTVVRLPLDGGPTGDISEVFDSLKEQLSALDAEATVFLRHLQQLVVEIDGKRRTLERIEDHDASGPLDVGTRVYVGTTGPSETEATDLVRVFRVWGREMGGDEQPEVARRIRRAVEHLPNRWPELDRVSVSVAVEETESPTQGLLVIFLPTRMRTGTGAFVNAPFYGSLNRQQIDFGNPYNQLLIGFVAELILDALESLAPGPVQPWRGRAVMDLLAPVGTVRPGDLDLVGKVRDHAESRDLSLGSAALFLCDDGWQDARQARVMPSVPPECPINPQEWRTLACWSVLCSGLAGRAQRAEALIELLGGRPDPTHQEWVATIERMARAVSEGALTAGWNDFLRGLLAVLPSTLREAPRAAGSDPLGSARILPTQDGRVLSANSEIPVFFQPVRGLDDLAESVDSIPNVLAPRMAFLHPDVETQDGPTRRNTEVQKFLEGRFVRPFRREEILREVVLPALPRLPSPHGTPESARCRELLKWTLRLVDPQLRDTLFPLLRRLPAPCHGGWHPFASTVFGPGWGRESGEHLASLAEELDGSGSRRVIECALLPPQDSAWGGSVTADSELLRHLGVREGLKLASLPDIDFPMSGGKRYRLPRDCPSGFSQELWDGWRSVAESEGNPSYKGEFQYRLSGLLSLPEAWNSDRLSASARDALSDAILDSIPHWPRSWDEAVIEKTEGNRDEGRITSPLKHWLSREAWLRDGEGTALKLSDRWWIREPFSPPQAARFSHLHPISPPLSDRLHRDEGLLQALKSLGLKEYPRESERIGPALLEALAEAWSQDRIPFRQFDIFLGQVRDAWDRFRDDAELPSRFLVLKKARAFSVRQVQDLDDVYLPDDTERMRSLREHGRPVLQMGRRTRDALWDRLQAETSIKRASALQQRVMIDGKELEGHARGQLAFSTGAVAWLPPVALTVAAFGGMGSPRGADTRPWRDAAERLRTAELLLCEELIVQLVRGDEVLAESRPEAHWIADQAVLAVRRSKETSHEGWARAVQDALDRQDLLKDLRLVLGRLSGKREPTRVQIEDALRRAEIGPEDLANIQHRWAGTTTVLLDRLRPALALLRVVDAGLDGASGSEEALREWLRSAVDEATAKVLLDLARRCGDDAAMGRALFEEWGEVAQLPRWNAALEALGSRYETVVNDQVEDQLEAHREAARPFLRAVARRVATINDDADLFLRLERINGSLESPSDWRNRWWEVPFNAVMSALVEAYSEAGIRQSEEIAIIKGAQSAGELHDTLRAAGIEIDPDPYRTAASNLHHLQSLTDRLHDVYMAWLEDLNRVAPDPLPPSVEGNLPPSAYLKSWDDSECLFQALGILGDEDFSRACEGCSSIASILTRLELDRAAVDARRHQRQRDEERRARKEVKIAGETHPLDSVPYPDLFRRIAELPLPDGPNAADDEFTPLSAVQPRSGGSGGGGEGGRTRYRSPRSPPPELSDLLGTLGEIHAYRFLKEKFGRRIVSEEAWVSEIRRKVMPLLPGQKLELNDGLGFDFRFRAGDKHWHVEVKATQEADCHFELGISEVRTASRLANASRRVWRILRVQHVLTEQPTFQWLPNPFEANSRSLFQLHTGGMWVSYRPE